MSEVVRISHPRKICTNCHEIALDAFQKVESRSLKPIFLLIHFKVANS